MVSVRRLVMAANTYNVLEKQMNISYMYLSTLTLAKENVYQSIDTFLFYLTEILGKLSAYTSHRKQKISNKTKA